MHPQIDEPRLPPKLCRSLRTCFLGLVFGCFLWTENLVFFGCAHLSKQVVFRKGFFCRKSWREGGLDVWTIRWLRELFLLCQLVVKLGARAAMDIYGVDADELAHCVALHVIEMKIDEIIVRKCSRVLRLIMERTGRRAAMFPFAVVLAGMEREALQDQRNFHASLLKSGPLWKSRPRFCTS